MTSLYRWKKNGVLVGSEAAHSLVNVVDDLDDGSYALTVTNSVSGKSRTYRAGSIAVTPATRVPTFGDYTTLVGTPPSILSREWKPWALQLIDQRLANIPLDRATTYYFSTSGDDYSGDGTEDNPWQSLDQANAIAKRDWSVVIGTPTSAATDETEYRFSDTSFTITGFVRIEPTTNASGALLTKENEFILYLGQFRGGIGHDGKPSFVLYRDNGSYPEVNWPDVIAEGEWVFVSLRYDKTTGTAYLSLNCAAEVSGVVGDMMASSTNAVHIGSSPAGGTQGRYAQIATFRECLTFAEVQTLYNGGLGHFYQTLPAAIKAKVNTFVSMTDASSVLATPCVVADDAGGAGFSFSTATRALGVRQDASVPVTDADPYGDNFALRFKRGDKWYGTINWERPGMTAYDWGDAADDLPVITAFSVAIPNAWTLVSGTHYKVTCDPIGWLKEATDDFHPHRRETAKVQYPADVESLEDSFCYDTVLGELHVNVGGDPAVIAPGGWVGTPMYDSDPVSNVVRGAYTRIENLVLLGSGISEPGNGSGYGIQISGLADEEFVMVGCEVFWTGYHAIGHICYPTSRGTFVRCKAGLSAHRNQSGTITGGVDMYTFVSYCGGGGQEYIQHECEISGPLKSWDWTADIASGGLIIHGDTEVTQSLAVCIGTTYPNCRNPLKTTANISGPEPVGNDWTALRSYMVDETYGSQYQTPFGLISASVAVVNCGATTARGINPGNVLTGRWYWLLNCTANIDLEGVSSPFYVFQQPGSLSIRINMIGCRFNVTNGIGLIQLTGDDVSAGEGFKNCVFTFETTSTTDRGSTATGQLINCAFMGLAAEGTAPVTLTESPSLTVPPDVTSDLYAAGATGLVEYDQNNVARASTPTIGPMEAQ